MYCPSWDYSGPQAQVLVKCAKTPTLPYLAYSDLGSAVWRAWHESLPAFSVPEWFDYSGCVSEFTGDGDDALSSKEVEATKRLLKPLCVTVMDKCSQCLLLQ